MAMTECHQSSFGFEGCGKQEVLDGDTTDLPLYIFCGEHVLCTRLREPNHVAAFGNRQEIERTVRQIRTAWAAVKTFCAETPASVATNS